MISGSWKRPALSAQEGDLVWMLDCGFSLDCGVRSLVVGMVRWGFPARRDWGDGMVWDVLNLFPRLTGSVGYRIHLPDIILTCGSFAVSLFLCECAPVHRRTTRWDVWLQWSMLEQAFSGSCLIDWHVFFCKYWFV